ncbi:hypothetical protein AVEN_206714-1 [Araneus ventricosus]|uniref:Uncharacterized protein n=1 Tax=Araneus ventricosus TaxID=182803 RepID=A0A4Y2T4T8_ARAVE|nr:hypothetical protein AVEN_206714-1 [Araneus ventricosus]
MIVCDAPSCQERYRNPGVSEMRQSSLEILRSSVETCSLCELVSCETPSAIVLDLAVHISESLSSCTSNLCKCCFHCYLRFVFSGIFENKASFTINLLLELFSPYIH